MYVNVYDPIDNAVKATIAVLTIAALMDVSHRLPEKKWQGQDVLQRLCWSPTAVVVF